MLVGKVLSFTAKLYFLSIHRAQKPRSGWPCMLVRSYIASTIGMEISPTTPLIFTGGGSKSAQFCVVFNIIQLWAVRA